MEPVCSIMRLVLLPCGKTCLLLFLVQYVCLHPTTNICGQHITPLPRNVSKGKIQSLRELEYICMLQHAQLNIYTVTITCCKWEGKKGSERKYMKSWRNSSLFSSLNMYWAFYSLSSMPLLLIPPALSGSLGRVTGWELWTWLLHGDETWTSKRG